MIGLILALTLANTVGIWFIMDRMKVSNEIFLEVIENDKKVLEDLIKLKSQANPRRWEMRG